MNSTVRVQLEAGPAHIARLAALQKAFAEVCNALAPLARQTRCWNRVALHHMAYKQLRQRFPQLGSQMICNAIYSVSRSCRSVYQHADSPFSLHRLGDRPLPLLQFRPHAPVYFDRHTLSLKAGQVSLYTLDGRMHFQVALSPADEQRFRDQKLREIVLRGDGSRYTLDFRFASLSPDDERGDAAAPAGETVSEWPEYVIVTEDAAAGTASVAPLSQPELSS